MIDELMQYVASVVAWWKGGGGKVSWSENGGRCGEGGGEVW